MYMLMCYFYIYIKCCDYKYNKFFNELFLDQFIEERVYKLKLLN